MRVMMGGFQIVSPLDHSLIRRWLLTALLALGLFGSATSTARAETAQERWGSIGRVDAGWDGQIVSGLASPWRVQLVPGRVPVAAVVEMRFVQDGSQQLSIRQRVALVPGQPASVQFTAAIPSGIREVSFNLSIEGGRALDAIKVTEQFASRGQPNSFRTFPAGVRRLMLVVGQGIAPEFRSVPSTPRTSSGSPTGADANGSDPNASPIEDGDVEADSPSPSPAPLLGQPKANNGAPKKPKKPTLAGREDESTLLHSVSVRPSELPIDSSAYESVHLLVISQRGLEELSASQATGLSGWLAGGGRVILIAPEPGAGWRKLLPPDTVIDPVAMGPPVEVPVEKAGALLFGSAAVAKALVRSASVTPLGQRAGWLELAPTAAAGAPQSTPLIVCGPVGIGHLTILLATPETLTAAVTRAARENSWRSLLTYLGTNPYNIADEDASAWRWNRPDFLSAQSPAEQMRTVALASMNVAEPRHALAWIVGVVLLLLGLQLGVIDPLLHRRQRRTRTYLFAALWIACGSGVVIAALPLLGSFPSSTLRVELVEQSSTAIPGCRVESIEGCFAGEPKRWLPRWPGITAPLIGGTAETEARSASPWQTVKLAQSTPAGVGLTSEQIEAIGMARGSLRFLRAAGNSVPRLSAFTLTAHSTGLPDNEERSAPRPAIRLGLVPGDWLAGHRPSDFSIGSVRVWTGESVCWDIDETHRLEDGSWLLVLGRSANTASTLDTTLGVRPTDGLRTTTRYSPADMSTVLLTATFERKPPRDLGNQSPASQAKSDSPQGTQSPASRDNSSNPAPDNESSAQSNHIIITRVLLSTEGWTPAMINRLAGSPTSPDSANGGPTFGARPVRSETRRQLGLPLAPSGQRLEPDEQHSTPGSNP